MLIVAGSSFNNNGWHLGLQKGARLGGGNLLIAIIEFLFRGPFHNSQKAAICIMLLSGSKDYFQSPSVQNI